jgi:hypothetical protein
VYGVTAVLALAVGLVLRNGGIVDEQFTDAPPPTAPSATAS